MIWQLALAGMALDDRRISITFPPTPVPIALRMLSRASGQSIAAAPSFGNDVILARLKEASVDTLISHLAESMGGSWKRQPDGTLMLVADREADRHREKEHAAEGVRTLTGSLQYLRNRLGAEPAELTAKDVQVITAKQANEEKLRKAAEAAQDYARVFAASSITEEVPAWRALAKLILCIDPQILLDMPNDAREVWAESPTPMQHAFPDACPDILAQYRRELALSAPTIDVRRVEVVFAKWETETAFNVSLTGLDSKGKQVDIANVRMNNDSDRMKIPYPLRDKVEPVKGESPLLISHEAQEARIALSNSSKDPKRAAILEAWKPRLEDPVRYEPTQWHLGADMVAYAEATGQNMVGTVNDEIGANYYEPHDVMPSQFLSDNAANIQMKPDKWMVVRNHEYRTRVSRFEARQWIRQCVEQGGVTVDGAAAWAAKIPERFPFTDWVGQYLHVLFPGRGPYSAIATTLDEFGLRLWDSLGERARAALKHGATINLADLPPEARTHINELVFWFNGLDDFSIDPTDRFPQGIAGGAVTMTISEKPVIEGWSSAKGPEPTRMPLDAAMVGRSLAHGSKYWSIPAEYFRAWDRYRIGVHRAYDLHFTLQPGNVPMTESLSETLFDPSAQTLDQLPEAIRNEVESARRAELAKPPKPNDKDVPPPR
ncbi:MAG: hypothetical protein P4L46_21145 [Fimbriimonas sp.]|nr:hypothetical protein [Fimbriimonas sp.]